MWLLGDSETQIAQWDSDVSLAITAVQFRYYIWIGGVKNYLQSNLTTFAPADNFFVGVQNLLEWSHTIIIPEAAHTYNMEWSATPNVIGDDFTIGEKHYVGPFPDFGFDGFVFNGIASS